MIVLTKYGSHDGVLINESEIIAAEIQESKYANGKGNYEKYTLVLCKENYKVPVVESPVKIWQLVKDSWEL